MTDVNDLLEVKGRAVWSISPSMPVRDALKLMAARKVGAVIVIEDGEIAGIFSERDFARKSVAVEELSLDSPVRNLMSAPVFYVLPNQSVEDCMKLMTEKHVRHLPVMDENTLIGIISIGDVVRHLMKEKSAVIEDLEAYILKNSA